MFKVIFETNYNIFVIISTRTSVCHCAPSPLSIIIIIAIPSVKGCGGGTNLTGNCVNVYRQLNEHKPFPKRGGFGCDNDARTNK